MRLQERMHNMSTYGHASDAWIMTREIVRNGFETYDYVGTEVVPYRSGCRLDVVGVKSRDNIIKVMEVKSCRNDFVTDKKWKNYLQFANIFYFIAPHGAILPDELPAGIGLIEFGDLELSRPHWYVAKIGTRLHEIGDKQHIGVLEALLYSVNRDKRIK